MDLLKDKKYVPETDQTINHLAQDIEGAFDAIAGLVSIGEDYDFMDLLNDHGYVPANDNIGAASNDNQDIELIAS